MKVTYTESEIKSEDLMVDDWIEIAGVLARVKEVEKQDDIILAMVYFDNDPSKEPFKVQFRSGWFLLIYNQQ